MCSVPHEVLEPGTGGIRFLENPPWRGTSMFEFIAFVALVVLLIAAVGLPYPQSWASRWNGR
jgi:hypothetical protein